MSGYLRAKGEEFAKHALASFLRNDLTKLVAKYANQFVPMLMVKGSVGQGNWSYGPWIGVLDPLVTSSVQQGYYVCYLFKEDMSGVYLSLNQGMTEAKKHYGADAKTALMARAQNFRAMLGTKLSSDLTFEIDLAVGAPSNDAAFYQAGNICALYYQAASVPDDRILANDLALFLSLYQALIETEISVETALGEEDDLPAKSTMEDGTRFRIHKRIERNANLVALVKKSKPHRCEVCSLDFGDRYGELGRGYIEAHHLRPVASIKGTRVTMDPKRDFALLCSNCHRMVHKSGLIDDLARFKREHFHE
jgi:5-methylcytosine-specific restriction protein A